MLVFFVFADFLSAFRTRFVGACFFSLFFFEYICEVLHVCVYEFGSATPREVLQSLNECVSLNRFDKFGSWTVIWWFGLVGQCLVTRQHHLTSSDTRIIIIIIISCVCQDRKHTRQLQMTTERLV